MKVLSIIANDRITPNGVGGGAALNFEHLSMLRQLGHDVGLWYVTYGEDGRECERWLASCPNEWRQVSSLCESVEHTSFDSHVRMPTRIVAKILSTFSVVGTQDPNARVDGTRQLRALIARHRPDVIWASHLGAASIALQQRKIPVIYFHHDWLFRVKALRSGQPEDAQLRRREMETARRANVVVTGSIVEAAELREIGCANVHYLPPTLDVRNGQQADAEETCRIVHLGGIGATANRVGLSSFVQQAWPMIEDLAVPMHVVGDLTDCPPELAKHLRLATCHGFVEDVGTVLPPYSIFVIPWDHSTGTRTKLPLAFKFRQGVVAVRAGVACFPEAQHGENCILVDSVAEMAQAIRSLVNAPNERKRLGDRAFATFDASFTRRANIDRVQSVLDSAFTLPTACLPQSTSGFAEAMSNVEAISQVR